MDGREQDDARADGEHVETDERQCRICLDGADAERELGRLIRPCLCKGSISVSFPSFPCQVVAELAVCAVCSHKVSAALEKQLRGAECVLLMPQCHYKYRFSRTRVVGIATNPGKSRYPEANGRLSTSSASDTWCHL